MKAEERKHLEHNTLAEDLGKLTQTFQQGVPRSVWLFVGGVVVVLGLIWTWNHFSTKAQRHNAELWYNWDQVDSNQAIDTQALKSEELIMKIRMGSFDFGLGALKEEMDLERLAAFVKENSGTVQGRLARFQLARLYLFEGLRHLGQDGETRNKARKKLSDAAKEYTILIKEARDIPVLHQEALLNCAKANESLLDLKEAERLYEQLRSTYPKSEAGKLAEQQLERLKQDAPAIKTLGENLKEVEVKQPVPLPEPPK